MVAIPAGPDRKIAFSPNSSTRIVFDAKQLNTLRDNHGLLDERIEIHNTDPDIRDQSR